MAPQYLTSGVCVFNSNQTKQTHTQMTIGKKINSCSLFLSKNEFYPFVAMSSDYQHEMLIM